MSSHLCSHEVCINLRKTGRKFGVSIAILNNYYDKKTKIITPCIMLGKENSGTYKNYYNICSGKMEITDNKCVINGARRELYEEFCLNLSEKQFFKYFNNTPIYINTTPIFYGTFIGLSRKTINDELINRRRNNVDESLIEIFDVDWFVLKTEKQLENNNSKKISSYAQKFIKEYNNL